MLHRRIAPALVLRCAPSALGGRRAPPLRRRRPAPGVAADGVGLSLL